MKISIYSVNYSGTFPEISTLGRMEQEDAEFKVSLNYKVTSCLKKQANKYMYLQTNKYSYL
jgi:hypothetical protein